MIITIDGPSSSGKSTVGEKLADNIGYRFLDTGCLYRALTVATLQRNIPITDTHAIIKLASDIDIVVQTSTIEDGRQYTVLIDTIDVTWELRSSSTDTNVSLISTIKSDYKEILTNLQTRDHIDTQRDSAPLRKPKTAHIIDTTSMETTYVLNEMLRIFHEVV